MKIRSIAKRSALLAVLAAMVVSGLVPSAGAQAGSSLNNITTPKEALGFSPVMTITWRVIPSLRPTGSNWLRSPIG